MEKKYKFYNHIEGRLIDDEWIMENAKEVLNWIIYNKDIPKEISIIRSTGVRDVAGIIISEITLILKVAPKAKKKIIRKKSRIGFNLSTINNAMGLEASVTPAIKAPISWDRPIVTASSAMPKHQAIASRNIYSWN